MIPGQEDTVEKEMANHSNFPSGSGGKESACNAGDPDLFLGLGRSPAEGTGYPLEYSALAGYSPWSHKELDLTERLTVFIMFLHWMSIV